MNIATRRPRRLGHAAHERNHVVASLSEDLFDPLQVERRGLDRRQGVLRHDAKLAPGLADSDFDSAPIFVLLLVGPDPGHLGIGVSRDHRFNSSRIRRTRSSRTPRAKWAPQTAPLLGYPTHSSGRR